MDSHESPTATLKALLTLILQDAGASCGAVFAVRGSGIAMAAQCEIDQPGLDIAHACWARHRDRLNKGELVSYGRAAVWPLFKGPELAALVYLDRVHENFPGAASQQDAARLVHSMTGARAASPAASYVSAGVAHAQAAGEFLSDQLAMTLDATSGNVTAAARQLGITRETVYERAERFGIDIDGFRPKRRSRRRER